MCEANMCNPFQVADAFNDLIDQAFGDATRSSHCGLQIKHPDFEYPICIPLKRRDHITADYILDELEEQTGGIRVKDIEVIATTVNPPDNFLI